MQIHTLPTGQLATNTYLIAQSNSDCLIIDPGDDADFITDKIRQENLIPKTIIATHGHFDHVMAVWELQRNFSIPFFIHQKDQFLLDRLSETASHFLGKHIQVIAPDPVSYIDSKEFKKLEKNFGFRTLHTPGHTPGSISLLFTRHPKERSDEGSRSDLDQAHLFSGDLIFAGGGRGRTDFSYCSESDIFKSIKQVLELPENTIIHPGHGEETTVQFEQKNFI